MLYNDEFHFFCLKKSFFIKNHDLYHKIESTVQQTSMFFVKKANFVVKDLDFLIVQWKISQNYNFLTLQFLLEILNFFQHFDINEELQMFTKMRNFLF